MAIFGWNPDKPEFSIEIATLGQIDILPLTVNRMKKLGEIEEFSPSTFTDKLLIATGRKEGEIELIDEEVARLSDTEREEFANQYLDRHQHLFREQKQEKRKDEDGNIETYYRNGGVLHDRISFTDQLVHILTG